MPLGRMALWLFLVPVLAQAKTAVVVTDDCSSQALIRHADSMREGLLARTPLQVMNRVELVDKLGGEAHGSIADAERQVSGSRADLFSENYERAERTLQGAIGDLLRLRPSEDRSADVAEALTLLSQVQLKTGHEALARETIARIVRVTPKYQPDPDLYPPSFRELFGEVRANVEKTASAVLRVQTQRSSRAVFIDGLPAGKSPVELRLPPGEYRVEADFQTGARGMVRTIHLEDRAVVELNEAFEGAMRIDAGPCLATKAGRGGRLAMLVKLGTLVGADQVIALREEEPANGERYLVATAIRPDRGEETREARVRLYSGDTAPGAIERLAEFIATGEAEPPVQPVRGAAVAMTTTATTAPDAPTAPKLAPRSEPAPDRSAMLAVKSPRMEPSHTASYVAFGASGLLAVGAMGALVAANGSATDLEALRDGGAFRAGQEAQVATLDGQLSFQRNAALGLAGAAVGVAVTGAVLWLTSSAEAAR